MNPINNVNSYINTIKTETSKVRASKSGDSITIDKGKITVAKTVGSLAKLFRGGDAKKALNDLKSSLLGNLDNVAGQAKNIESWNALESLKNDLELIQKEEQEFLKGLDNLAKSFPDNQEISQLIDSLKKDYQRKLKQVKMKVEGVVTEVFPQGPMIQPKVKRIVTDFLRPQIEAQTNPAIDSLREVIDDRFLQAESSLKETRKERDARLTSQKEASPKNINKERQPFSSFLLTNLQKVLPHMSDLDKKAAIEIAMNEYIKFIVHSNVLLPKIAGGEGGIKYQALLEEGKNAFVQDLSMNLLPYLQADFPGEKITFDQIKALVEKETEVQLAHLAENEKIKDENALKGPDPVEVFDKKIAILSSILKKELAKLAEKLISTHTSIESAQKDFPFELKTWLDKKDVRYLTERQLQEMAILAFEEASKGQLNRELLAMQFPKFDQSKLNK